MEIKIGDNVKFKNGVGGTVKYVGPESGMCYSRENGRSVDVVIEIGQEPVTGFGKTDRYSGWEKDIVGNDFISPKPAPRLNIAVSPAKVATVTLPDDQMCGCGKPWGTCDGNSPYCG